MKKFISMIIAIFMMVSVTVCFADNTGIDSNVITVVVDGDRVEFDQNPIIEEGTVLVPMRFIFEKLGATVNWDNETNTAVAIKDDAIIVIQIGNSAMFKNETKVELEVPAKLVADRTLIPVRAVYESLGCKVNWIEENSEVIITSDN